VLHQNVKIRNWL